MTDDPLEQCQQRLLASLDRALKQSAATDPLLCPSLRSLRERLGANLTAPHELGALGAEAAEVNRH